MRFEYTFVLFWECESICSAVIKTVITKNCDFVHRHYDVTNTL